MSDPLIWAEARQRLPLDKLLEALGDGQYLGKKAVCPFCSAKSGKWSVFQKKDSDRHFFKCFAPGCVAGDPDLGNSEVGYLALRRGIADGDEACKEYLKLAVPDLVPHLFVERKAAPGALRDDPPEKLPRDGTAKNPWHALWKKLPLTAPDHAALLKKRGFSPKTIERAGIRSNNHTCKPLVESLEEDYDIAALIAEGIYKEEGRRNPTPSGQFCGYGITGEKDEDGEAIWAITEPPIIPYFGPDGIPFYLRPHKGGVKRPKDVLADLELFETDDEARACASHVFVPPGFDELVAQNDGTAILTEGEFKALAGMQCDIAILAEPGVSFIRNPEFRRRLLEVLDRSGVTDLVIIFDNEVKDDPAFPKRYKPDPENQCDTEVYAEYTLRTLRPWFAQRGGSVRVGMLPDEYRVDGKADFDGILAQMVEKHGLAEGTRVARRIFRAAIENASSSPTVDLFPTKKQRTIECRLERWFHASRLPAGGKREKDLAKRFREIDPATREAVDGKLADALDSIIGCYYLRKKPDRDERALLSASIGSEGSVNAETGEVEGRRGLKGKIAELETLIREASTAEMRGKLKVLYGQLAATWERIKGIPEPISTFTLECEFKLHTDGIADRLVRVVRQRNGKRLAEKELRRLTAMDMAALRDFRRWCYGVGDAVFGGSGGGGDKDLQDLVIDMDHHSYLRDIHELDTFGLHLETGIWFFGDVAYPPTGPAIHADKSNIFWHNGMGYRITASGNEDAAGAFCQGMPNLLSSQDREARPGSPAWIKALRDVLITASTKEHRATITLADQMLAGAALPDCEKLIAAAPGLSEEMRRAYTAAIFQQASEDLFNTVGDYDGWTAVGLMLAYAVGPELCKQGGHPGVWLTGKMSSGKTTIGRWLMRFWGFRELGGVKLGAKSSTAVGLGRALTQYSSLPMLLDEYRRDTIEQEKEETLRGAFDRSGGVKGIADASKKTRNPIAKTTPIVMGESSSGDGATRSRYAQIHISINKRIGDGAARYVRMQQDCKHYYLIGRWLMENRVTFVEGALENLSMWMHSETVRTQISNDRVRLVYGVAFACYHTAAALLGTITTTQLAEFQAFLMKHGAQGLADVVEETFLAKFWSDVITIRQRGKDGGEKYFQLRWVTAGPDGTLKQVHIERTDSEDDIAFVRAKTPDAIYTAYIASDAVFDSYKIHKVHSGDDIPLSLGDVRREMEKEPYWMPTPSAGLRCHRIRMGGTKTSCWVLNLSRLPGDEPEHQRPYLCSFGTDLVNVLTPDHSDDAKD